MMPAAPAIIAEPTGTINGSAITGGAFTAQYQYNNFDFTTTASTLTFATSANIIGSQSLSALVTVSQNGSNVGSASGTFNTAFYGSYDGTPQPFPIATPVSTVPLPASAPLFGLALLALTGFGFFLKRSRRHCTKLLTVEACQMSTE
jgi:hypothetical protein